MARYALVLLGVVACGGGGEGDDAAGPRSGTDDPSSRGGDGGGGGPNGDGGGDGGDAPFTPVYGRFGAPEVTFTIPVTKPPAGQPAQISLPNIMATFPDVDWAKLDRLYIPAGTYRNIQIGGLPMRDASRPLVITNIGGQVKAGGYAGTHPLNFGGGSNWILTGRYDPVSKTGDAGFRGHAEGDYAGSRGKYGIFSDDALSKDGNSGLVVGGKATDFELDVLEIARAEFAGVLAKTDSDGSATMRNVRMHDTYIHDVGSEGIYFGSTQNQPQHTFEKLSIYDNRIVRAGTEALQVGQLGDGCEVHHNVLGPGAVRWRSAFADFQNGNIQWGQRHGSASFHHNIVIGTGDLFVEFMPQHVDGDTHGPNDTVTFADNYFADTSKSGVYTHATANSVSFRFERNVLRGFDFNYDEVYPNEKPPTYAFSVGAGTTNLHVLAENRVDATIPLVSGKPPSTTLTNNTQGAVPRVAFRNFMGKTIEENFRRLEWWTDRATRAPGAPVVTYRAGALVVHRGVIYEAITENAEKKPDEHPQAWRELPPPADDVRLAPGSPSGGLGVRWPPPAP